MIQIDTLNLTIIEFFGTVTLPLYGYDGIPFISD